MILANNANKIVIEDLKLDEPVFDVASLVAGHHSGHVLSLSLEGYKDQPPIGDYHFLADHCVSIEGGVEELLTYNSKILSFIVTKHLKRHQ